MKKAIVSVILLICTALTALLLRPVAGSVLPERISLYLTEESRIITLSYRDYLAGCVFGAVSPACGKEALDAIACAVNSKALYLLKNKSRSSFMGADLNDDPDECLPFMNADNAMSEYGERYNTFCEKVYESVDYGMRHALTYNDNIISAEICRFSTGMTDASGELPYLASVAVSSDENAEAALSTRVMSSDTVMRALYKELGITALPDKREKWFSDAVYLPSGTLSEIRFGGKSLSGQELKEVFGLRSAAVTVEYTEQRFVFTVKGWGNNLGMSINGACVMARKGCSCEEILAYFYQNAELTAL